MNIKNENLYSTSDLALVTTLSLYLPISGVDNSKRDRVTFHFSQNSQLEQLISDYWNGAIKVEPKQFFSQIKIIKSRIYEK